jgi:hypothetical protein
MKWLDLKHGCPLCGCRNLRLDMERLQCDEQGRIIFTLDVRLQRFSPMVMLARCGETGCTFEARVNVNPVVRDGKIHYKVMSYHRGDVVHKGAQCPSRSSRLP